MKKIMILSLLLSCLSVTRAQMAEEGSPEFERLFTLTAAEDSLARKEGVLGLFDLKTREYGFDEEGNFKLYFIYHHAAKIMEDGLIQEHDRLGIPSLPATHLLACEGRLIREGRVIRRLGKEDRIALPVNEGAEEERQMEVLLFDDARAGDIVEFYLVYEMESIAETGMFFLQYAYPVKNMGFQLIMPSFLKADMIAYRTDAVVVDSVSEADGRRFTSLHIPFVKGLKREPYSFWFPNAVMVDYVIAHNYRARKQRFNTIEEYGNLLYNILGTVSKNDKKALKKISAEILVEKDMDEKTKIRAIENRVKEDYGYLQSPLEEIATIEGIAKYGVGNTKAYLRLYHQLFDQYGIPHDLVSTADRERITFDPNFNSSSHLNEYIFYFPNIDQYLSPDINALRLGWIPPALIGQFAVFFEATTLGSVSTYLPEMKPLPIPDQGATGDTLRVEVSIDPDKERVEATVRRAISGYNNPFLQARYKDLTEEGKIFMVEHYLALDYEDNVVRNERFSNHGFGDAGIKPFVMEGEFTSAALTTQERNGFALKTGALIGEQGEYKWEEERLLPVDLNYPHHYHRTLILHIPPGYVCQNLEEFNYAVYDHDEPGKAEAAFTVEATQEGNIITLVCEEYYDRLSYPAREHALYARVLNAAFDFTRKKMFFVKP